MCNACGMNHFDDDDIDYDDEALLASLGIDSSNNSSHLSTTVTTTQQVTSPVFVAVEQQDNQIKALVL